MGDKNYFIYLNCRSGPRGVKTEVLIQMVNRFGQFTLLAAKHDFTFQAFEFILQFLQFPACFSDITHDPVGIMSVIYVDHCEESEEEKKRKVTNHPLITDETFYLVFFAFKRLHYGNVINKKSRVRLSY